MFALQLLAITLQGVIEGDAVPQLFIPKLVKFYDLEQVKQAFEDSKNVIAIKPILILDKE